MPFSLIARSLKKWATYCNAEGSRAPRTEESGELEDGTCVVAFAIPCAGQDLPQKLVCYIEKSRHIHKKSTRLTRSGGGLEVNNTSKYTASIFPWDLPRREGRRQNCVWHERGFGIVEDSGVRQQKHIYRYNWYRLRAWIALHEWCLPE